jgi:hypothetical protein
MFYSVARSFSLLQTAQGIIGTHQLSYSMGTGDFSWSNQPVHKADNFISNIMNEWNRTSISLFLYGASRDNFAFYRELAAS